MSSVLGCRFFLLLFFLFFFKQKTAYEMRISDWSSDVCSSDLRLMSSWSVRSASLDNGGSDIGLGVIGHCGSTGGCLGFCHEAVLRLHQANADRHYYRDNDSQLRPAFDINERSD